MIGLVDYDIQSSSSSSNLIPNVEIMKLATFYRNECNTFCRLINLNEQELEGYETIYFFSEAASNTIIIPEAFRRSSNIKYGGTGFTNNYIPFENSLIDYTIPRISIYKDFLKQKYQEGIKTKVIERTLNDSYYRNYAGEYKLPVPPIYPNRRIFLFDKKFFYEDWKETLQLLSERKPSSIVRIHPVVCTKLNDFFTLRSFNKFARSNEIVLELNIPLEDVNYMLNKYKNLFLAEITTSSNIYLSLGNTFKTSFQYYKDYIYKLNLLYSFWSKNIPIKIKYIYPNIGINDPLQHLSLLTETWANRATKVHKTLNDRLTIKDKKKIPIQRQERDLLLKFHPEAKILFDQTQTEIINGRYWKI